RLLQGNGPALGVRRLHRLHVRRRPGPNQGQLRPELHATGRGEGEVRPRQPLPHEPEHQAEGMTIRTRRLALEPAPVEFLEALYHGDRDAAGRFLGVHIAGAWFDGPAHWMERRIGQLKDDPALAEWLLHAMALQAPD